jgi:adrenodoxin-NADP+ reductase
VLTDDRQYVSGIRFAINQLSDNRSELATITNQLNIESIDCGLIIYSIGYQTIAMAGVPMRSHVIDTSDGCHVTGMDDVYASGWCARGPTGVLVSTQYEALTTATAVCNDIEQWRADGSLDVKESALALLINRRVPFITWQDWKHIDAEECRRGEMRGKPREKFTSIDEILDVVERHRHGA